MDDFKLQAEEVTGIFKANIKDVFKLFKHQVKFINIEGYDVNNVGIKIYSEKLASKSDFVPHGSDYYLKVLNEAHNYLK